MVERLKNARLALRKLDVFPALGAADVEPFDRDCYTAMPMRCSASLLLFAAVIVLHCLHCNDQAFAMYEGTVTESAEPGSSLDSEPNPMDLRPIKDARVSLCDEPNCEGVSDRNGGWGPLWSEFAVFGGKRKMELRVEADGYVPVSRTIEYPSRSDRLDREKFVNFRMRRNPATNRSCAPPCEREIDEP
jgi:hypothetical protein